MGDRPELYTALLGHRGNGAVTRVHRAVTERNGQAAAVAAAEAELQALAPIGPTIVKRTVANTRRLAALAFAVLFRGTSALSATALASLAYDSQSSTSEFMTNADDMGMLRSAASSLPADQQALVTAAFYL
jgi:hypothetical protein